MKKYNFRLETIRRVRRTQEDIAKSALAQANGNVQRAISMVESRTAEYEHHVMAANFGATGVDAFMKQRYFTELAAQAVEAARQQQEVARLVAEERRREYVDAATKVKALDRLDERRREEFRIESDRDAEKQVDDIVVSRAADKRHA